jgi:hypothetical protein
MSTPTATSSSKPAYLWLRHTLAILTALSLGYVAASGIQYLRSPGAPARPEALASMAASSATGMPYRPLARPRPPASAARLSAAVVVAGNLIDHPEQLALPSDSVFALSLRGDHHGSADVYAINPAGQSSHIWSGRLQAGQDLRTPEMRLQGMRGTETLRIVFRPDAVDGHQPATLVRQLEILHL